MDNQRDTNHRDSIETRNQGTDRWGGYAPKELTESFGEFPRIRGMFSVLSEIQRYYVIEERSDSLPKEYFTMEQIVEYFKVGFKNGLFESLIFLTLVPFLQVIYPSFKYYFLNEQVSESEILFFKTLSYVPLVLSTAFVIYIGKYYSGDITRRCIFALMNGRSIAFVLKGVLFYFLLQWFADYSLKNPNILYGLADYSSWLIWIFSDLNISQEQIYIYYYSYVVPSLRHISLSIVLIMGLFALLPFLAIFFKSYVRRVNKQIIKERYDDI